MDIKYCINEIEVKPPTGSTNILMIDLIKLKHIRQNYGITLKQLQQESGLSKSDLYEIENETGQHTLDEIEKYTTALNKELTKLDAAVPFIITPGGNYKTNV